MRSIQMKGGAAHAGKEQRHQRPDVLSNAYLPGMFHGRCIQPARRAPHCRPALTAAFLQVNARELSEAPVFLIPGNSKLFEFGGKNHESL